MKLDKKKLIPIIISVIIIILIILVIIAIVNKENEFDKKISLIQDKLLSNREIKANDIYYAFISVSDGKNKAYVEKASGETLEDAINNVKDITKNYITKNKIKPTWVKIDIVNEKEEIKSDSIEDLVKDIGSYYFRKGISFDNEFNLAFLEAEINSNNIINYENKSVSLIKLNKYLKISGYDELDSIPEKLQLFTTIGYICDENNVVYELHNDEMNYGRRVLEQLTKEEIKEIININTKYLQNNILNNGKYIYGYSALTDTEFDSYNILRHAGTTWSLITQYGITQNKEIKSKTKLTLDYMIKENLKKYDENISYIVQDDEIKLGANGLAIIALVEYMQTFNTSEYIDIAKQLGNGIIKLQNKETGQYTHVLDAETNEKEKFSTVYYDGEATFALLKLYGLTKEEKYLDTSKKAIQYFIDNKYEQYSDQWIAYTINEITKYDKNPKYFELGLKNAGENFDKIGGRRIFAPTQFELLMQTFELYQKMLENNITIDYLEEIDISELVYLIKYSLDFGLNTYMYPEVAMYLDNPSKYLYTFYVRNAAFRIRIDDIQHSISAYLLFYNNYEKFVQLEKKVSTKYITIH